MEDTENVNNTIEDKPKRKNYIKRFFKIVIFLVLVIIGLNVLLYILLSIPSIQQKVANFAIDKLKTTLKTEVTIDEVRLSLFNHATLKGIYIEDQAKDTLLYAHSLDVSLDPWKLIKNKTVEVTGISIEDFLINVNRKDSVSDFNFDFIINAFSSGDTTKIDTTKSTLQIVIQDVNLKRGRLNYNVLSDPLSPYLFNASHIALYDLNSNIDLNSIDGDKLDILINNLSAKEKSGLEIKELKGNLLSDKSKFWVNNLSLLLPNSHLRTNNARYDLSNSEFEIGTEDTEISPLDLTMFLPNLKFLKNKIQLKTNIKGTLPSLNIENIAFTYGEDCMLYGKASISDYARYGIADIDLSIDKFKISPSAINSFAKLGDSTFTSPDILKYLGDIYLKGILKGKLSKFKLDAETWCKQGAISILATGATDSTFSKFDITSNLSTQNFNLGQLLGDGMEIGRLSTHLELKAKQRTKEPLSAAIQGKIDAIQYQKDVFKNIPFDAFYNAEKMGLSANADLSIGKFFASASMTQTKVPDIKLNLRVDGLHVDHFYKQDSWVNPRLSLALNGTMKGLDIDNMIGKVDIDSLDFRDANFNFRPGKFTLESGIKSNNEKFIALSSSILSADITGQYAFMSLSDEFSNMMHNYLPDVFLPTKPIKKPQNNFTFNITANNSEELSKILSLPINIILPSNIKGRLNTIDSELRVKANLPYIRYNDFDIKNTSIDIANIDSAFNIAGNTLFLMPDNSYRLSLNMAGVQNSLHALVNVASDSSNININGRLEAIAQFSRNDKKELVSSLKIIPSDIKVDKLALNLFPSEILNEGARTEIQNFAVGLNNKKYFSLNGVISDQKTDSLKAYFNHADIGNLLEVFDINNINACVHGNLVITNILDRPELYTQDLEVADIVVFSDTLGTMTIESQWSDDFGGIKLDASLKKAKQVYAELDGTVYTNQDSLDLQLRLEKLPLEWTQPFVAQMLNKISGSLSTNLIIEGNSKAPKIRGFLGFNDTQIGVDYTNVVYTISDTIRVSPDKIGFENLTLKDSNGNTANVNATVTHKNFENMKYHLDMQMKNLMVLNTEHRIDSLFYGKVFASGSVKIDGDDNGINMNMQIKNDKNSTLNILLPQRSEASDYNSVVYINVPEEKLNANSNNNVTTNEKPLPLRLNVKLTITPDILLGVVIDPLTGDAMEAKGNGSIVFDYDMQSENMTTFGDYSLTDGNVKLNLQKIKKLDFRIQQGSTLYFIGNPLKTKFDITAYRRIKADLKTLDASFDTDKTSSKVSVDCILGITGNIDKMDVTYNISLPDTPDDIQRKVNSLINTDEEKIKQFASLIASNTFYSSMGNSGTNFSNGLWTSLASSTLSSGLTSLVGNILGNGWQIGTNIESNDGTLSDMNMSVMVSKKFLDDKLKFNTNLGYRTDQSSNTDNSLIGDFDVEYQLNSMWTLKAYSHTNDKFYRQAPTTQGIGIVYSKEAATLKRLFQSFRPRRRNRDTTPQSQPADSTQTKIEKQPIINDDRINKNK